MKTCNSCKETKEFNEFHKRSRAKDGLQSNCKSCNIDLRLKAYHNKPGNKEATRLSNLNAMNRNKQYVIDYLNTHPCVDCKESDIIVLQFDHVRGVKDKAISLMVSNAVSIETLQNEIDKCEVRCANCHCRKTASQFGFYKTITRL